jgi:four helix bundle protein
MGRLDPDIIERAERLVHRVVDVAEALAEQSRSRRVVDQLMGCGTSVGANVAEADEAQSRADFCRILGTPSAN